MPESDSKQESRKNVDLFGETVEYETTISEDATQPRIDVDIHGVRVVLPIDSEETPSELLRENASWVLEKKETYDRHRRDAPERRFEEGERFPYLGSEYEVRVEPVTEHELGEDTIRLSETKVEQTDIAAALREFYRNRARSFFEETVEEYAEKMEVSYKSITLRNQRTRWGSCSAKENLSFNWRLLMAPEGVAEYVVVHELAHLREKNHNKTFWRIVGEYMMDYKQKAAWLEENSTALIFSEQDL
jgi:predicted metal-dependent hydrolase